MLANVSQKNSSRFQQLIDMQTRHAICKYLQKITPLLAYQRKV